VKNNKPKQLEFNFNKTFVEASNKYDDTNYIYNPADNGIYTEQELKKKFTAQENYKLLKSVANQQEKKDFRDIERKYKKKSSIDQRTVPFSKKDGTGGAVKIDITALPKINPFNIPQDPKPKRIQQIRSKAELGGLAYLLGEYND
jgi:hypothetical protein